MLKKIIHRQEFHPSWFWGVLINPFYLIRSRLKKAIEKNAVVIQGNVLDVGCGTKPYQELFQHCNYTGLDIESSRVRFKEKVDVYYDGGAFPFSADSFDAVVCFEVLEHVSDTGFFLNEIFRVLKTGGKVLITVPFSWEEHEAPYDFFRFTSFGLTDLFEKNNFKILELQKATVGYLAAIQLLTAIWSMSALKYPRLIRYAIQLFLTAPVHALAILFARFLPQSNALYLSNVILAEKR